MGMAPGAKTHPRAPLLPVPATSSGGRLQELTGLSRMEYLKVFDRANCLTFFPGKSGRQKGDVFPMREAKMAADIHKQWLTYRRVIFVGRQVATAFGWKPKELPWFTWKVDTDWKMRCTVIPHTSGCNRFWNDPENRERARLFFQNEVL